MHCLGAYRGKVVSAYIIVERVAALLNVCFNIPSRIGRLILREYLELLGADPRFGFLNFSIYIYAQSILPGMRPNNFFPFWAIYRPQMKLYLDIFRGGVK